MFRVVLMAILLQGCSVMDVVDLVKPSKGLQVDTEIVAGDKKTSVTAKKETTNNTATNLTQDNRVIHEGPSLWDTFISWLQAFTVGLLVGWLLLPSARQMTIMGKKVLG